MATDAIREAAKQHHIKLHFTAFAKTVEQMQPSEWQQVEGIIAKADGPLLVNASFALHHVVPTAVRHDLFSRLKQYQPRRIGLIEPYADFLTPQVEERFQNAWLHYGLTFKAIDQIEASDEQKRDLKTVFFSREIQDVLSVEEQRVEQFETGEMWSNRLIEAGFKLSVSPEAAAVRLNFPMVDVAPYEHYLAFTVGGSPIVSIMTGQSS
jgi:hypothetical protein